MASHQEPAPADERVYEETSLGAEVFWEKYRNSIIGVVVALVVAGAAVAGWSLYSSTAKSAAEALFAEARGPEGWNAVIEKYPDSMPAADAYFLLAQFQRDQGRIEESTATFQKILAIFPKHPLAGGASLGIAENLLVSGKGEEAMNAFRDVQVRYSNTYAAPVALMLEGRMFISQGKLEDARRVLNTFLSAYPDSFLRGSVEQQLQALNALLPPSQAAVSAPSLSMPPGQ